MPEMRFSVRWPDETVRSCYSPSLVVKEFLTVGESYPLSEFVDRCRGALAIAGERVRQKYGFHCTGASAQLCEIESTAAQFAGDPAARVTVLSFE
jgi:uncharacterized repeat protein (TIGR04042 family)